MAEMDDLDRALLTTAQAAFPLCSQPFKALGEALGLSEAEAIHRLRRLRGLGVLRQLSAIFDSRALGYGSVLVAAHLPAQALEEGARRLCAHPGVSHCYEREHYYNLWFTLATPPGQDVAAAAGRLCEEAASPAWHILPALKTFKIGVKLDLTEGAPAQPQAVPPPAPSASKPSPFPADLFDDDKELIRALQEDLPLLSRPFAALAAGLGLKEEQVFDWMAEAGRRGFLRRFAAVLRHRQAGFSANGMGVWAVPEAGVEALGRLFAAHPAVSHCYQRPRFSDWPYNLFTMVHARSREECQQVLDSLAASPGIEARGVLYSLKEFKKERVKYFLEDRPPQGWRALDAGLRQG